MRKSISLTSITKGDEMLTTEQVKKIAEYIHPNDSIQQGVFSANYDSDAMKVFKALVDECKKRKLKIIIEDGEIFINKIVGEPFFYSPKFNNENICLAYLAVMESK